MKSRIKEKKKVTEADQTSKRSREKYQKSTEGLSTKRRNQLTELTGKRMKDNKHKAAFTLEGKQCL